MLTTASATPVATPLNSLGDLSALSVAQQLAPPKSCDVPKLLLAKKLDDLKFINQVEQPIFDRLHAESEAARVASRTPFLYVDLTDKRVLPLWIHPEQVGGKMKWTDTLDDEDDGYAKLGRALKGATETSRFFRSFAQWSAAFWRYAVAAVATDQMKWTWAIAHSDQVCQLAESERHAGRGPYVAFVYDDMLRRQVATRCVKKDPALKMAEAFESIDKELLQVVRQRLESVLVDAGLSSSSGGAKEKVRLTPLQGAQDFQAQAQQAAAALASQQHDILERAEAMPSRPKGKGKGKGKRLQEDGEYRSNRQQKKHDWYIKKKQEIDQRKDWKRRR